MDYKLKTNEILCEYYALLVNYNQCWEGYFGNVLGYRLQVTLLKM